MDLASAVHELASRAVAHDQSGDIGAAIYYYDETLKVLSRLPPPLSPEHSAKAEEYLRRSNVLKKELMKKEEEEAALRRTASAEESDLDRAYFLLREGLDDDDEGNVEEAIEHYSNAVELCLKAKKTTEDAALQKKLTDLAMQALERAEKLKGIERKPAPPAETASAATAVVKKPLLFEDLTINEIPARNASGGRGAYSDEEKRVLGVTSMINGREYVPFLTVDLKERFASPIPFSDKHGKLALAPKQRSKLVKWAR